MHGCSLHTTGPRVPTTPGRRAGGGGVSICVRLLDWGKLTLPLRAARRRVYPNEPRAARKSPPPLGNAWLHLVLGGSETSLGGENEQRDCYYGRAKTLRLVIRAASTAPIIQAQHASPCCLPLAPCENLGVSHCRNHQVKTPVEGQLRRATTQFAGSLQRGDDEVHPYPTPLHSKEKRHAETPPPLLRAPSQQCRDARLYGLKTTVMYDNEYTLSPTKPWQCPPTSMMAHSEHGFWPLHLRFL